MRQNLDVLNRWLDALTYAQVRSVETSQVLPSKPDGSRLRGVPLTPHLVLGRDRQFYHLGFSDVAHPMARDEVAKDYDASMLKRAFQDRRRLLFRRLDLRRKTRV